MPRPTTNYKYNNGTSNVDLGTVFSPMQPFEAHSTVAAISSNNTVFTWDLDLLNSITESGIYCLYTTNPYQDDANKQVTFNACYIYINMSITAQVNQNSLPGYRYSLGNTIGKGTFSITNNKDLNLIQNLGQRQLYLKAYLVMPYNL